MVLTVWDHITYHLDVPVVLRHLLPTFEGIAEFFTAYMLPCYDDGECDYEANALIRGLNAGRKAKVYHTGPTASPENSYTYLNGQKSGALAFSPAIDVSVLRQVSI